MDSFREPKLEEIEMASIKMGSLLDLNSLFMSKYSAMLVSVMKCNVSFSFSSVHFYLLCDVVGFVPAVFPFS